MIIIAFDPGTNLGVAVCDRGKIISSGVEKLDRGAKGYGWMYKRLRRILSQFHQEYRGQKVCLAYEHPAFLKRVSALLILFGLIAHLQERALTYRWTLLPVHPVTLKKWATGNRSAEKAEMQAVLRKKIGWEIASPDEADACLVALYAWDQLHLSSGETK